MFNPCARPLCPGCAALLQSLVMLLWALARLQASGPEAEEAVEAVSLELAARMEQQLADEPPARPFTPLPGEGQPLQPPSRPLPQRRQPQREGSAPRRAPPAATAAELQAAVESGWEASSFASASSSRGASWDEEGFAAEEQERNWEGSDGFSGLSQDQPEFEGGTELPLGGGAAAGGERPSGSSTRRGSTLELRGAGDAAAGVEDLSPGQWDPELSPSLLCTLLWAWGSLGYLSDRSVRMAALLLYGGVRDLAPADMCRCEATQGEKGGVLGRALEAAQRPVL